MSENIRKDFQKIPGVGKSIAQDFIDMGFRSIDDLKNQDPENLYQQLCDLKGCHVDRCMLYGAVASLKINRFIFKLATAPLCLWLCRVFFKKKS